MNSPWVPAFHGHSCVVQVRRGGFRLCITGSLRFHPYLELGRFIDWPGISDFSRKRNFILGLWAAGTIAEGLELVRLSCIDDF